MLMCKEAWWLNTSRGVPSWASADSFELRYRKHTTITVHVHRLINWSEKHHSTSFSKCISNGLLCLSLSTLRLWSSLIHTEIFMWKGSLQRDDKFMWHEKRALGLPTFMSIVPNIGQEINRIGIFIVWNKFVVHINYGMSICCDSDSVFYVN